MRALLNVLDDLFYQFRLGGALGARLGCVLSYYASYLGGRLRGLEQGESRTRALRALGERGVPARVVTVSWPPGLKMACDLFSAAFMIKEFDADRMYELVPGFHPQSGQTVVDVGGHQGFFTVPAAAAVGPTGRVVTVEADPGNFALLKRNVEANGLGQVVLVPMAAADKAGRARFFVFKEVTGGSLVMEVEGTRAIEVETDTLDAILERQGVAKVDLMKIDVEGACLSVLKGAPKALAGRPRLVMEVEGDDAQVDAVRAHLAGLGYATERFGAIVYARPS
ncbi:MAG: FkbM family methyltransferase [Elusimicrobiota bacterium]|nr:FkbM family methyltransferase [Elusimicrobiota bacterium]